MAPGQAVIKQEGSKKVLVIDFRGLSFGADVALYEQAMKLVVETLQKIDADEVVLSEYYERIYNSEQTAYLKEIGELVTRFETDTVWSPTHLGKSSDSRALAPRHDAVLRILNATKGDPFKAYLMLMRELKTQAARVQGLNEAQVADVKVYLSTLQFMRTAFESTHLLQKMKEYLGQLSEIPSGREVYHSFFEVSIKPSFIGSRIFFTGTEGLELVDQYDVLSSTVRIYKHPDKIEYLYFINPPEYSLQPEKYFLLEKTKEVVSSHRPENVEFLNISQARKYFQKIYVATIADLAAKNNIALSVEEKEELATIVSRYTIGYGILELVLSDRQLTDVYIDSPLGEKPIYLVHSKYGQCQTNIIFSEEEAKSTVSRFRALSGRPFDEAHPILDFDLPDLQTRIAVIGRPMATDGTAFALRLHKDTPWTLCQFIDNKMFDSLTAGLFSFFVDAQASMLIVGSRGSGKTSFIQSLMQEIPQNLRIIVQEDSVTSDMRIIVEQDGRMCFTTVGKLIDSLMETYGCEEVNEKHVLRTNPDSVKVYSLHSDGQIKLTPVTQFSRHKVSKDIYEIETRTGKKIKTTADHSLFTLDKNSEIVPIKPTSLTNGSFIATPEILPMQGRELKEFNALPLLLAQNTGFLQAEEFKQWIEENKEIVKEAGEKSGYLLKSAKQAWKRRGLIPIPVLNKMLEKTSMPACKQVFFKLDKKSKPITAIVPVTDDLLKFAGLWIADGCFDGKYAVIISVNEPEENHVVNKVSELFGLSTRMHSDGFSKIISNTGLAWFVKNILELTGNAYTKQIPHWAFNLTQAQKAVFLNGLYSGDGHMAKNEAIYSTCSLEMAKQIEALLYSFGIVSRIKYIPRDKTYRIAISDIKFIKLFKQIGFLQKYKNEALQRASDLTKTHDTSEVIPLPLEGKKQLSHEISFNRHDYITLDNNFGKIKLTSLLTTATQTSLVQSLSEVLSSQVYWDEVLKVTKLEPSEQFVYDFSVPNAQNFVCENIIAHNTLELPVPALKKLGLNIQRMKTRPPLGGVSESEVSAEDALRTALRLGDSVLIVGEVRSTEARALYEAMRVGAVGNVVMGTIHGESAYSIWDRVVNDLGVPTTSFKATDFCLVAAPIRFKGSIKRARRVIEVTEVKKHWETDPDKEGGFLNWMAFDANKDALDFDLEKTNKESEWLKKIMKTRGLTLDQIWSEIKARAETKQYLVDLKRQLKLPVLLEAEHTTLAHNKYLIFCEKNREETGSVDHKRVLAEWKKWVDEVLVKDAQAKKIS